MTPTAVERIGPYEAWGFGHGSIYDRPRAPGTRDRFVMATVQYKSGAAGLPAGFQGEGCTLKPVTTWQGAQWGGALTFMPMMAALDEGSSRRTPRAAEVAEYRKSAAIGTASRDRSFSGNAGFVWRGCDRSEKPKAILAVVDDGIPFAHASFRDRAGRSRIEGCWIQGADADSASSGSVAFGREFQGHEIDRLVSAWLDEDILYRAVGATERDTTLGHTIEKSASHGSHVMDAAAGHRHGARASLHPLVESGDLDDIGILAVQLPSPSVVDTIGFGKDALVLSAFHYIFDRADRLSKRDLPPGCHYPLVINFSFGSTGGPKGGFDALERALRELVLLRRAEGGVTELIMPSGNSFQRALNGEITGETATGHARGRFDIPWRLQPDDHTPNYLEIWFPEGADLSRSSIRVADPAGTILLLREIGGDPGHVVLQSEDGGQIGQLSVEDYGLGEGRKKRRVVVILAPTEPDDPALPRAACGLWQISLNNVENVYRSGPIACRVQRDESPFAYVRGAKQSYFDDPYDRNFEPSGRAATMDTAGAFVRRFGSINGLASHEEATVVGGFVSDSGRPASYSAAGQIHGSPLNAGNVHFSASSDTSPGLPGTLAAGTRSGATARLDGTSVAAPRVARALVLACRTLNDRAANEVAGSIAHLLLRPHVVAPLAGTVTLPTGVEETAVERLGSGMLSTDCETIMG